MKKNKTEKLNFIGQNVYTDDTSDVSIDKKTLRKLLNKYLKI